MPTMGYLHEGHLRLADHARRAADVVAASIFVNPIQFGPTEDLASYPRDLARDRTELERRRVDCLFAPPTDEMYRADPVVRVSPGPLARYLCGASRPGHFEGVLTVVAKLFHIAEPDVAVFGRKDIQQALIIKRMIEDLSFSVEAQIVPTVREPDGVAMSSRNIYLTPEERTAAPLLSRGLEAACAAFRNGATRAGALVAEVREVVGASRLIDIDYVEVVDPVSLAPVEFARDDCFVAIAARLGKARLIDNVVLGQGVSADDFVKN